MERTKEINLLALAKVLLKKAWIVVLAAVVFGIGGYIYSAKFVTPMYEAGVLLYVNNSVQTDKQGNISASDLATSQRLVTTYIIILQSNPVMEKVAQELEHVYGNKLSGGQIRGMITAGALDETEVFSVRVKNADPVLAAQVANCVAAVAPKEIENVILGSSGKVVQEAKVPSAPVSPNKTRQAILMAVIGAALAIVAVVVRTLLDVRIKGEEDLALISSAPVLGFIPELTTSSTSHYSYTTIADKEVAK